jgi:hypothetical protein
MRAAAVQLTPRAMLRAIFHVMKPNQSSLANAAPGVQDVRNWRASVLENPG